MCDRPFFGELLGCYAVARSGNSIAPAGPIAILAPVLAPPLGSRIRVRGAKSRIAPGFSSRGGDALMMACLRRLFAASTMKILMSIHVR